MNESCTRIFLRTFGFPNKVAISIEVAFRLSFNFEFLALHVIIVRLLGNIDRNMSKPISIFDFVWNRILKSFLIPRKKSDVEQ